LPTTNILIAVDSLTKELSIFKFIVDKIVLLIIAMQYRFAWIWLGLQDFNFITSYTHFCELIINIKIQPNSF